MSKRNEILIKSKTKASGLKSMIITKGNLVLTAFGKGPEAIIEKRIHGGKITYEKTPKAFDVSSITKPQIDIIGMNHINAKATNPLPTIISKRAAKRQRAIERAKQEGRQEPYAWKLGDDLLHAKDELERRFFGRTFDDNIKVQIAYNVLDIKKIMAPHINDIIFSMNNLRRTDPNSIDKSNDFDYVGTIFYPKGLQEVIDSSNNPNNSEYLKDKNALDKFRAFLEATKPYMPYFGSGFVTGSTDEVVVNKETNQVERDAKGQPKKRKVIQYRSDEAIFDIFRLVNFSRQAVLHGTNEFQSLLFQPNQYPAKQFLDSLYKDKVEQTNKEFISNNKRANFHILFHVFQLDAKHPMAKQLCREFYEYIVMAEGKNLGFSIRKLREQILTIPEATRMVSHDYDTVRTKLYTILDFILYKETIETEKSTAFITNLVDKLRANETEEGKEEIYRQASLIIWPKIRIRVMNQMLPLMKGDAIKNSVKEQLRPEDFSQVFAKPTANSFSKLMYFLTHFLDGKQINDMLTGVINKLENIDWLLRIDKNVTTDQARLLEPYRLLEQSGTIANELRFIKSISRMSEEPIITKPMYLDAIHILGIKPKQGTTANQLANQEVDDELALSMILRDDGDKNLRNFIINNVIESKRFRYLVRYVDPNYVRVVANNRTILKYVLQKMPDAQIDRYFTSVVDSKAQLPIQSKIDQLVNRLVQLKFDDFEGVKQNVRSKSNEAIDKERKKALLGLYLTVLYHAFKNLVNINSRYTIAFHCLERDFALHNIDLDLSKNTTHLTEMFCEKGYLSHKQIAVAQENLPNFNSQLFKQYRDKVAHLNIIQNAHRFVPTLKRVRSYFELYHFVSQSLLNSMIVSGWIKTKVPSVLLDALQSVSAKGNYSKNALHILHVPFAYNTARYKNLSIGDLFDMNETKPEVKETSN